MAGFGKRPWGSSPFGSITSGITGIPEVKTRVPTTVFGAEADSGTFHPEAVLSVTEFENSVFFGGDSTRVNPYHISAYVKTFTPGLGTPSATSDILIAKSWSDVSSHVAYNPGFQPSNSDIGAIIKSLTRSSADISAYAFAFGAVTTGEPLNLPASLQPLQTNDLPAILAAIDAANLTGAVTPIPGFNLPAQADPIPSVNLSASGGGHFPENVTAYLAAVLPVDLPVYIRGGFSDTLDLATSLIQVGQILDLNALLKASQRTQIELPAKIGVVGQGTKNLPGFLQPYNVTDITAFITTQRISNVRAIIKGFSPSTSDVSASVARIDSASFDMQAHTIAQFIALNDIAGKIRIIQLGGNDIPSSMTAVLPFLNINRIPLQLAPLFNLDATLAPAGGHLSIHASTTPLHHASTGTAEDAGFVITASSYRFYLGTTRGLFIPPQTVPQVRLTTYKNNFSLPDLHATIAGWNVADLSAFIRVNPYTDLIASLVVRGYDHLSDLIATVSSFSYSDIQATLTPFGQHLDIQASVSSAGLIGDMGATLVPFIDPLSRSVVSVSTQPVADLGALINYDSYVGCSPTSLIASLGAYIKPLVTGTPGNVSNLSATLTSSLAALDVSADIVGKKKTRIRILDLTFTAKTRGSTALRGSIVPLRHGLSNLPAQITGLLHEVDLPAAITPIRYKLHDVKFTATESVINLKSGVVKDILLSFRSQVQHYVYEDMTNAVYATDRGTWAIDLRTLSTDASFFDRSLNNREYVLDQLAEFYSLDEAIRAAIVILTERRHQDMSASITVKGAIADLGAQVSAFSADRVFDLNSKIMPVVNIPDISAAINTGNQSSGFATLAAIAVASNSQTLINLAGQIFGDVSTNIAAEITGV